MKKFFQKFLYFTFFTLVLSAFVLGGFMILSGLNFSHIPAINLSNSYSFNEKMIFLRENKDDVEVMAIGSSMSLNNIHSKTVADQFATDSYINTGSWGLNMEEIYHSLLLFYPYYNPEKILLSSNLYDFMESSKVIRFEEADQYLKASTPTWWMYLKTFDLRYFFSNFRYARNLRTYPHNLDYLGFDTYGGVNFESERFDINQLRYNARMIGDITVDEMQYSYVDSISRFCATNNIELIFFQGPIRDGITSNYSDNDWLIINSHQDKIEKIIKSHNQHFFDSNEISWEDHYFYDNTHLSAKGAKRFTQHVLQKYQSSL